MEEEKEIISKSRQDESLPLQEKAIGGNENKAVRNVLFDLLRILAMFFIVVHHIIIYDMGFMDVQTACGRFCHCRSQYFLFDIGMVFHKIKASKTLFVVD